MRTGKVIKEELMTTLTISTSARTIYDDWKTFERLVENHRGKLSAYARRLSRNSADAEDLVQETLLRAYTHRHTLRESGSIASWLFVTLRNLFINQRRQQARHPHSVSIEADTLPEIPDSSLSDPELITIRQMEQAAVHLATAALPDTYRIALLLADQEGLSYQEISDRLDLPIGTVRSRISRARQRVQRALFAWRGPLYSKLAV
jgi:RNA polymerase sigma-70 factor, ECF subfamily